MDASFLLQSRLRTHFAAALNACANSTGGGIGRVSPAGWTRRRRLRWPSIRRRPAAVPDGPRLPVTAA